MQAFIKNTSDIKLTSLCNKSKMFSSFRFPEEFHLGLESAAGMWEMFTPDIKALLEGVNY